jgi:hypothetical protein
VVAGLPHEVDTVDPRLGAVRLARAEAEAELAVVRSDHAARGAEIDRLHAETTRLQGMLDQIFASRTWKLHAFLHRLRPGRGSR